MLKKEWVLGLAAAAAGAAAFGEVVYRNDFTTRTSTGRIPDAEWHELAYPVGREVSLYRNYGVGDNFKFTGNEPWTDSNTVWDEWAKAFMELNTMKQSPGLWAISDPVHGSADNPCALFRSSSKRSGTAVASLHNEFKTGILRIEADIRRPAVWGGTAGETYCCRVAPLYRKTLDLNWGVGINTASLGAFPTMFGAIIDGNGVDAAAGVNRLVMHYAKADGSRTSFCPGAGAGYVCSENWYRWRVYVDLDRGRSNAYIWDAGSDQPSTWNDQADATATRVVENDTYYFSSPLTEASGGIAGIGLNCYRTLSGTEANFAITNAPCFDNIRIAWKAPDGKDYRSGTYETVYENDFALRRYRTLQPIGGGETSYTYPRNLETSVSSTFSDYVAKTNRADINLSGLVVRSEVSGVSIQPVGTDNWRRLSGTGAATVIDPGSAGGLNLRIHGRNKYLVLGTRLCETVTSGKVRISADVRLPKQWQHGTRRVCLALGSMAHWTGTDYTGTDVGYGAIVGDQSNTEFSPAYLPASESLVSTKDVDAACRPKGWYRMVVTADLDAKTYDYALYDLGDYAVKMDTAVGEPVFTATGVGFRNAVDEISSFSLWSYGAGDDWDNFILWDSIQVWKNVGMASEKRIYANAFDERTHYLERERCTLVGKPRTEDGLDHWMNLWGEGSYPWVVGDANRFLSVKTQGGARYWSAQPIGTHFTGGRVRISVDMRPPECWNAQDGGRNRVNFYTGGSVFEQGLMMETDNCANHAATTFGFYRNSGSQLLGYYTNVTIRAVDGIGLVDRYAPKACEPGHWYRFVATVRPSDRTWSLKTYDMGTEHPDIDAGTPSEAFAAFDGLTFRETAEDGLCAIGLTVGGCCGCEPWNVYDPGRLLCDNIVVEKVPMGLAIMVR